MSVFERADTMSYWTTIRDRNKALTTPSAVSISIYDPCGRTLINNASMTANSTGVYYYDYAITSTATYGEYAIKVKSVSGGTLNTISKDQFFVMPWTIEKSVRRKTGISDEKDISDDDLSHICWVSYQEALRDVYTHAYKETPNGNPDTGAGFDGTNTSFQTNHYPIADINGDGTVTGTSSCASDMTCWWIDSTGSRNEAVVNITKYKNGEINIFQINGTSAIPSTNEGVYLDYWYEYSSYNEFLFREAVSYLAAHYTNLRFTENSRVTLADINASKPIILLQPNRFLKEYRRLISYVCRPKIGGVN